MFKKRKKSRVCVIGLDGVPHSLVTSLAQRGVMPAFAELLEEGLLQPLKASLPEISAVSWTDFMTGTNSGTHGIFGFTDFKPGTYQLRFPNFLDVKCPTFWDRLAERGKRCIVINQPSTYPARKINGILISGFVALELGKAVYPMSVKTTLDKMHYQIDIDTVRARRDPDFLWQELDRTLASRQKAWQHFWPEDWDYFELVITGTDRLHHFLWRAWAEANNPHHQKFLDYYSSIDRFIARIVNAFTETTGGLEGLFLLSDHGFCGINREFYLNAWLEKEGYLKFKVAEPESLEEIDERSLAFALDPNRIYLHTKGKFPHGRVLPSEGEALKREIRMKLEKLEQDGERIFRRVFDAEEVYSGPFLPRGPDLIAVGQPGFDIKGSPKKKELFGQTDLQGMHTWDNAFIWSPKSLGNGLAISNVARFILRHFEGKNR